MALLDLAQAEKKWKKVKPITLTKTGISDILRKYTKYDRKKMTAKDCSFWIAQIPATMKDLDKSLAQDRVKKNKAVCSFLADVARSLSAESGAIMTCLDLEKKMLDLSGKTMGLFKDTLMKKDERSAKALVDHQSKYLKLMNQVAGIIPHYFDAKLFQKSVHVETLARKWLKDISSGTPPQKELAVEFATVVKDWSKLT